jgi:hypothetical protein
VFGQAIIEIVSYYCYRQREYKRKPKRLSLPFNEYVLNTLTPEVICGGWWHDQEQLAAVEIILQASSSHGGSAQRCRPAAGVVLNNRELASCMFADTASGSKPSL